MQVEIKGVIISRPDLMETILGIVDGNPVAAITNMPTIKRSIYMELMEDNYKIIDGEYSKNDKAEVAFKVARKLLIKSHSEKHAEFYPLEHEDSKGDLTEADEIMLRAVKNPELAIKQFSRGNKLFKITLL
jgi:hypothetical protein